MSSISVLGLMRCRLIQGLLLLLLKLLLLLNLLLLLLGLA